MIEDKPLKIGDKEYQSRLLAGTGKYADYDVMDKALAQSGAEIITVALRRVDFSNKEEKNLLEAIDPTRFTILPNTAGCYNKEDAIKVAHMARELEIGNLIKLEVLGDEKTLLPDDPVSALKLQEAGAAVVMPAGSPIGCGRGIINRSSIRFCIEALEVPCIVDAGVGTASDVAIAFELGADGVLLNTAIATAQDPVAMARAMRLAATAGRTAYLAGRMDKKLYATASSPIKDF
jgi:thiazole synthase